MLRWMVSNFRRWVLVVIAADKNIECEYFLTRQFENNIVISYHNYNIFVINDF